MSHSIHTCVSCELLRHCFCKLGINDCNVGSDFKVCKRILDALLVVCDYRESSNFCCCTGSGRNSTETSLLTKFGNTEYYAHFFKCDFGIFILDPHCLCSVDGRATADCNDPVGLELCHGFCSLHNCINGRIGFDTFKEFNFHSCFLEVRNYLVKKTELFHRTAANANHCASSFECLKSFKSSFAVIEVSG